MNEHPHASKFYILAAAFAGAVTSLSMMQWQAMTWPERMMTVFAGTTFAVFVMPWVASSWAHTDVPNLSKICAATYIGGTGANVLIPVLIRKIKRLLGEKEGL